VLNIDSLIQTIKSKGPGAGMALEILMGCKPTEVTREIHWLYAENWKLPLSSKELGVESGKWLIFAPKDSVDTIWAKIRKNTEKGLLGPRSKVSTSYSSSLKDSHVICVYTLDYRDVENVKGVLKVLRRLGIKGVLSYKTNKTTKEGIYGRGASIYSSNDFESKMEESNAI